MLGVTMKIVGYLFKQFTEQLHRS